ncbi:MAG: nucleotide pyrophosphohydrolase [Acholeplasmataceae bacterium]
MMDKLIKEILKFRDEREWKQFHTPGNLSKSIVIESAELLENFQWGEEYANIENIKEELADIFIYGLLLMEHYNFDFNEIIKEKINKNKEKYPIEKAKGNANKYDK